MFQTHQGSIVNSHMNTGMIGYHDQGRQQNHRLDLAAAGNYAIQITFPCFLRSAPIDVSCKIRCSFNSGAVNLFGTEYNIKLEMHMKQTALRNENGSNSQQIDHSCAEKHKQLWKAITPSTNVSKFEKTHVF